MTNTPTMKISTGSFTVQVPAGLVWMSFHFRETNANWLTNPVYVPISLTAEYKACAFRVEKIPPATAQKYIGKG
jgi:hypothetical protein